MMNGHDFMRGDYTVRLKKVPPSKAEKTEDRKAGGREVEKTPKERSMPAEPFIDHLVELLKQKDPPSIYAAQVLPQPG